MKIKAGTETGYGAGVLFFCPATGNFLWVKRSNEGDFGGHWCCGGGGVEDHETIEQGVRREVREELGYDEPYVLEHMHRTQVSPTFIYHNHLAKVDREFVPVLNDEHTQYVWSSEIPKPIHPGLMAAIEAYLEREAR